MYELKMKVNENLANTDSRQHAIEYLERALPGVRDTFMEGGSLKSDARVYRSRDGRGLTVQIAR